MDSFFEAEVEMERKICRDVVCTSHKDEEGKHTFVTCLYSSQCREELFTKMYRCPTVNCILCKHLTCACLCVCVCDRFSSRLV